MFRRVFFSRHSKYLLFFILLLSLNCNAFVVKVAIVDQLMSQKLSSIDYADDYMRGIATAIIASSKQLGISVKIKQFPYGKGDLGPLSIINDIKNWDPDLIIGPRASNKFLLLQPYFHHILVISPLATANQVYQMPKNFFSMSLSDRYSATEIASYATKAFPKSEGALIVDAADCVSCKDVGQYIAQYYKDHYKNKKVIMHDFIGNNVESVDVAELTKNWKKGYIIYVPNISYVSGVLISRISDYLHINGLVFVGDDEWGTHEVGYIGKLKTTYPYDAYHLEDWSLDDGNTDLKLFKSTYIKTYGTEPTDPVSYAAFHALYSIMILLKDHPPNKKHEKQDILNRFLTSIKIKNLFKQKYYVIYKWDHSLNKDVVVGVVKTGVQ